MYPTTARTITYQLEGASSFELLPTGSYTILGVSMQQSSVASISLLNCGTNVVARNYAKDLSFNAINYICNDTVSISKTGQDDSTFIITYVPYDTSTIATTTVLMTQGYTYGDIFMILLLIMIFTQLFFSAIKEFIFGVRIENPMNNKYNKNI